MLARNAGWRDVYVAYRSGDAGAGVMMGARRDAAFCLQMAYDEGRGAW